MITHTLLISFDEPISEAEVDQVLKDIEAVTTATGVVQAFAARTHIAVPGEEHIPAFIASAILQIGLADVAALGALFTAPAVDETFDRIRTLHPYTAAWANHEPWS